MKIESKLDIVAYLKPACGWSNGVRAILDKYGLGYVDKDIINNPDLRSEMVELSGQHLSPCVVVNGKMLADISGEELENWLVENNFVERSDVAVGVSINTSCEGKR